MNKKNLSKFSRRDFLRATAAGIGLITVGGLESACSLAYINEKAEDLNFPDLEKYPEKVQPSKDGHYFGIHVF